MKIDGEVIPCPYWMNKLKNGKLVLKGYLNGKGSMLQIRARLISKIHSRPNFILTEENIRKIAKRERVGIDCSGFAYRVLDKLVRLNYRNCQLKSLDDVFKGGINRTNASMLTNKKYTIPICHISDCRSGDLIRMMGGKHVAIILEIENGQIIYVHSASRTKIKGVHIGKINIIDENKPVGKQEWLEETKNGESIVKKYFDSLHGDGVFRLKIFV